MTREERDLLRAEWRDGRDSIHVAQRVYFAVPRLLDALDAAEARADDAERARLAAEVARADNFLATCTSEARADKAEADAAAMRAFFAPGQEDEDPPRSRAGGDDALHFNGCGYFRDEDDDLPPECDCGYADAMDGTAGRALLDEVAALRAQVADLTRERDDARNKADEMRQAIIDKVVEGALDDVLASARAWAVAAMTRVAELEADYSTRLHDLHDARRAHDDVCIEADDLRARVALLEARQAEVCKACDASGRVCPHCGRGRPEAIGGMRYPPTYRCCGGTRERDERFGIPCLTCGGAGAVMAEGEQGKGADR